MCAQDEIEVETELWDLLVDIELRADRARALIEDGRADEAATDLGIINRQAQFAQMNAMIVHGVVPGETKVIRSRVEHEAACSQPLPHLHGHRTSTAPPLSLHDLAG